MEQADLPQLQRLGSSQSSYLDDSDDYMSPSDAPSEESQVFHSGRHGPRVAAINSCSAAKKEFGDEEDVEDDEEVCKEEVKEEVRDSVVDDKQQPSGSDVTFGSIPKTASRSHNFQVDRDKLAIFTKRKLIKWK